MSIYVYIMVYKCLLYVSLLFILSDRVVMSRLCDATRARYWTAVRFQVWKPCVYRV